MPSSVRYDMIDIHALIESHTDDLEYVVAVLKNAEDGNNDNDSYQGYSSNEDAAAADSDNSISAALELAAKQTNSSGELPLHTAMKHGTKGLLNLVKMLLKLYPEGVSFRAAGAADGSSNGTGRLPIHEPFAEAYFDYCTNLDRKIRVQHYHLGHSGKSDDTNEVLEAIKCLLQAFPASINYQCQAKHLPFHSRFILPTLAQYLIIQYPDWIHTRDENGNLPLHVACQMPSSEQDMNLIKLLFRAYSNGWMCKNNEGELPPLRSFTTNTGFPETCVKMALPLPLLMVKRCMVNLNVIISVTVIPN